MSVDHPIVYVCIRERNVQTKSSFGAVTHNCTLFQAGVDTEAQLSEPCVDYGCQGVKRIDPTRFLAGCRRSLTKPDLVLCCVFSFVRLFCLCFLCYNVLLLGLFHLAV